jgi:hypothetical protein
MLLLRNATFRAFMEDEERSGKLFDRRIQQTTVSTAIKNITQ